MRDLLSGVTARVERLTTLWQKEAAASNLESLLQRLDRGRMNRQPRKVMTPEEFTAWSERLRASVRGPSDAKLAERLISARRRADTPCVIDGRVFRSS